jgi:hypothetical protein
MISTARQKSPVTSIKEDDVIMPFSTRGREAVFEEPEENTPL